MNQLELNELIRRCKEGDGQALATLMEAVRNSVYFRCKRILKKEEDAQDATQDVCIVILTSLDKLRQPEAFWGWVNGIIANHCKHLLSQDVREWQFPEDEEGNSLLDSMETIDEQLVPDKALDNEETRRMMLELIDALPPAQRMCVLCYYYDQMSVKEIAEIMGTAEGTVKSRLNYARKAIKEGVEDYAKKDVKLYGFSPLLFLAYFLRKSAETEVLDQAVGESLTQAVLNAVGLTPAETAAAGAETAGTSAAGTGAAGTSAAGTSAAGAAASGVGTAVGTAGTAAVGTAAAHILSGLTVKVIAGIVAGVIAVGGITVGVSTVANRGQTQDDPDPSISARTEDRDSQSGPEDERTMEPEDEWTAEPEDARTPVSSAPDDALNDILSDMQLSESHIDTDYNLVQIYRTTLDTGEYNLEVYFERPIFFDFGRGYRVMSAFFVDLNEKFFSPENKLLIQALESAANDRPDSPYFYTCTAQINEYTEDLVSVSLSSSWYVGGLIDHGTDHYTFRTDTGEQLGLADLIGRTEMEIKDMIAAAVAQQYPDIEMRGDILSGETPLDQIRGYDLDDFQFYVTDGHIHICFDQYELSGVGPVELDAELPAQLNTSWN